MGPSQPNIFIKRIGAALIRNHRFSYPNAEAQMDLSCSLFWNFFWCWLGKKSLSHRRILAKNQAEI